VPRLRRTFDHSGSIDTSLMACVITAGITLSKVAIAAS